MPRNRCPFGSIFVLLETDVHLYVDVFNCTARHGTARTRGHPQLSIQSVSSHVDSFYRRCSPPSPGAKLRAGLCTAGALRQLSMEISTKGASVGKCRLPSASCTVFSTRGTSDLNNG
eukprot:GHVU01080705.1.p1 GENE.GHVU01080705.1~~GHVU01080705.1.p1  ORF type:complete len:117 (-),score=1.19 GHVU01080705.1:456-806(-)